MTLYQTLVAHKRRLTEILIGSGSLTPKQQRVFTVIMLVVTSLYLVVELGFNARLLDVVGGLATLHEIDRLEIAGRVLSGISMTILALSWQIQRGMRADWGFKRYLVAVPATAAVLMGAASLLQQATVGFFFNQATAEERSRAALLVPMTHLMTKRDFNMKGLRLSAADLRKPEGKTFLATFPLLALSVPDMTERVASQGEAMFELYAETQRGTPEHFHAAYQTAQGQLEQLYDEVYVPLNRRYRAGEFGDTREKRGETLAAFYRDAQTALGLTTPMGPNLTVAAFLAHSDIQTRWRQKLGVPDDVKLVRGQSRERFITTVYDPTIISDAERYAAERLAPVREYADGGRHEQIGTEAYRALIVPPVALAFSLLGAVMNLLNCSGLLREALGWQRRKFLSYLILAAAVAWPLALPNKVSEQLLFKRLTQHTYQRFGLVGGTAIAWSIRWTTQAQPYFYPINEYVRVNVLGGLTYGYEGSPEESNINRRSKT